MREKCPKRWYPIECNLPLPIIQNPRSRLVSITWIMCLYCFSGTMRTQDLSISVVDVCLIVYAPLEIHC